MREFLIDMINRASDWQLRKIYTIVMAVMRRSQ